MREKCKCFKKFGNISIVKMKISLSDAEFNILWKEFNDCVSPAHGHDDFIHEENLLK